ncbi:hypothetical protein B5M09_006475 [Aphanomyces astaci]|uniref:RBR-type E3 ubiquitin transferase n=1 Tax=Aphanomyces astaci TaxID=112090 RepID=A0A3R8DHD0_APHAT|nr:hypothetical protein B5M09_006475 [Aphanomyces astaci]
MSPTDCNLRFCAQFSSTMQAVIDLGDDADVMESSPHAPTPPPTCLICMDELPRAMNGVPGKRRQKTVYKPDDCWRLRCGHFYCVGCLSGWIESKIDERKVPIVCASLDCAREVRPPHVAAVLSSTVFEKFSELVTAKAFEAESMYCPNKECSQVFVKPTFNAGQEKTTCLFCKTKLCLRCQVAWHDGLECDQYKRMVAAGGDSDEAQLHQLKEKFKWKQCPKCNVLVERSIGCNYMRCNCGEPFCYACGTSYAEKTPSPGNPHGKPGCNCGLYPPTAPNPAGGIQGAMAGALDALRRQMLHLPAAAADLVQRRMEGYRIPIEFENILRRHLPQEMQQHRDAPLHHNLHLGRNNIIQHHLPHPIAAVVPGLLAAAARPPRAQVLVNGEKVGKKLGLNW